jgi:hypothetical protein
VLGSIGSVGDACDNSMADSFVDSFKTELIADRVCRSGCCSSPGRDVCRCGFAARVRRTEG